MSRRTRRSYYYKERNTSLSGLSSQNTNGHASDTRLLAGRGRGCLVALLQRMAVLLTPPLYGPLQPRRWTDLDSHLERCASETVENPVDDRHLRPHTDLSLPVLSQRWTSLGSQIQIFALHLHTPPSPTYHRRRPRRDLFCRGFSPVVVVRSPKECLGRLVWLVPFSVPKKVSGEEFYTFKGRGKTFISRQKEADVDLLKLS